MTHHILLVEDDASIARFVRLALAPLPVALHVAISCAQARAALAERAHTLVLTDLTLPDGDGLALIAEMQQPRPPLQRPAKVAVFSARLGAATRRRSTELGVWRVLDKPVSLATLRDCVIDATDSAEPPPAAPPTRLSSPPPAPPPEPRPAGGTAEEPSAASQGRAWAIAHRFGGRADLYDTFLAASREQLRKDLAVGEEALARRDTSSVGRLAHSLRAALDLLGAHQARDAAEAVFDACAHAGTPTLELAWLRLSTELAVWDAAQQPQAGA